MVRLPDSQRLELRLPDGAANPYLLQLPSWRRDWMVTSANWILVPAVSATPKPIPPWAVKGEP